MTFTIEQLEALKEEITPGQWEFREHSSYEYPAGPEWGPMQTELEHAVLDAEGNHLFGAYNNYKLIEHPGNLPLAAASPALLDQLIETIDVNVQLTNRLIGVEVQAETAEYDRKLAWREMDAARAKAGVLSAENAKLKEELGKLINFLDGQQYEETDFYTGAKFAHEECRAIITQILEGNA